MQTGEAGSEFEVLKNIATMAGGLTIVKVLHPCIKLLLNR